MEISTRLFMNLLRQSERLEMIKKLVESETSNYISKDGLKLFFDIKEDKEEEEDK